MTEKNIFIYKLCLSLNISDFILFYFFVKVQPNPAPPPHPPAPEKSYLPLFQQPPSQSWSPLKPPLFENLVGSSTPPVEKGWGWGWGCTLCSDRSLFRLQNKFRKIPLPDQVWWCNIKRFLSYSMTSLHGTNYPRMDQVNFVEDSL